MMKIVVKDIFEVHVEYPIFNVIDHPYQKE